MPGKCGKHRAGAASKAVSKYRRRKLRTDGQQGILRGECRQDHVAAAHLWGMETGQEGVRTAVCVPGAVTWH